MTAAATQSTVAPPNDPVGTALLDSEVRAGLFDHARSVLGRRLPDRRAAVLAEAAAEAVQETELRALQKRHAYDPAAGAARAWLHGIMNHVLEETARSLHGLPAQAPADPDAWDRLAAGLGRDPAESVSDRLAAADYLAKLSAEHQQVIHLRFYEELSHDEIAVRLGVSPVNARVRLCRALIAAKAIAGVGPGEDRR